MFMVSSVGSHFFHGKPQKICRVSAAQDLYADETGYGACPDKSISCPGMTERDAALEECLHVISDTGSDESMAE